MQGIHPRYVVSALRFLFVDQLIPQITLKLRGKYTLHNGESRDRYNRGKNIRYIMENPETDTTEGKIYVT